jgi:hypothetical protein
VDGERTGAVTPDTLRGLDANLPHDITLRLSGYAERTFPRVRVASDSTHRIVHAFAKATSPLKVASDPAGAQIELDGRAIGTTPHLAMDVEAGRHVLRIAKEGYEPVEQTIEVPHADISVALAPLAPGAIVFSVQPYAEVLIDGRAAADHTITYLSVSRPPGDYTIELRHPEFASETRVVHVAPGDTARVSHSFLAPGGAP